jgi:hypothetical protein
LSCSFNRLDLSLDETPRDVIVLYKKLELADILDATGHLRLHTRTNRIRCTGARFRPDSWLIE